MVFEKYMSAFNDLSFDDLEQVKVALERSMENKRNLEIESIRKEISKRAKELGIEVTDIIGEKKANSTTRKPVLAKYRIVSLDGSTHEWSGRGIKPKVFAKYSKEELEDRFKI